MWGGALQKQIYIKEEEMLGHKTKVSPERVDAIKTRRLIEDTLRKATPKDLVRVAEILGVEVVEVAVIPEICSCDKNPRPCFGPDQVRCVHQIKKGLEYLEVYGRNGKGRSFTVVREPFYKTDYVAGWWIEVKYPGYKTILSLQDHNIFPYNGGKWNESNWLAFTDKSRHLAHSSYHHHCPYHHCFYYDHCHCCC